MASATIADGCRVEYDVIGRDQPGLPFVLIEGLGAHYLGWREEFCQLLVEGGHPVVRLDNRDVGLSQRHPGTSYSVGDMADDVRGLIDVLALSQVHVVGQSMGGMIAQELVIRHPGVARSLALFYTAPSMDFVLPSSRDAERIRTRPAPSTREDWVRQYLEDESECASPAYAFDVAWKTRLAGLMWDRSQDDRDGTLRQRRAISKSRDRLPLLKQIEIPTVVFHGTADALVSDAGGRAIADAVEGSDLHIYDGMGHELPRDLWPEFAGEILRNSRRASGLTDPRPAAHV